MPVAFTIVMCIVDAVVCLTVLVFLMASLANSTPESAAPFKTIMWIIAASGLAIPVAIVAMWCGRHPLAMLLSVIPVLACLVLFVIAWDVSKWQISPELRPSIGRLIGRSLTVLVFGGGGLVMFYVGAREWMIQRTAMRHSTPVNAEIIHSEVKTSQSRNTRHGSLRDDSTITHSPEVKFRYTIDGRTYESDRLRPSAIVRSYASKESAADEIRTFPLGATVQAFVIPSMPDKAFLLRESSAGPIVFLVLGFLLTPIALAGSRLV